MKKRRYKMNNIEILYFYPPKILTEKQLVKFKEEWFKRYSGTRWGEVKIIKEGFNRIDCGILYDSVHPE